MYVCFGSSLDNNVLINIMLGGFQPESVEREGQHSFQTFLGKDPAVNSREYSNTMFAPNICKIKIWKQK